MALGVTSLRLNPLSVFGGSYVGSLIFGTRAVFAELDQAMSGQSPICMVSGARTWSTGSSTFEIFQQCSINLHGHKSSD